MNGLALIDLHLHLDGSLSLKTVKELADMQAIAIPEDESLLLKMLQVTPDCKDLNEYLEKFDFPCSLLQTGPAITRAVENLLNELQEQGLLYAEVRFAPQLHTNRGLTQQEVVEAALEGLHRGKLKANLILCCMRGDGNREVNLETVRTAARYLGKGVCAVDLAGAEALFSTAQFEALFDLARELEIPFTIHAGEADGPESVTTALNYGASRIGHGVRSLEDPALTARLAREEIPLELCPTSNLNTNIFPDMEHYPIVKLMEAGVKVTVNTDNIMVSGVTLDEEVEKVANTFAMTREQMLRLQYNAAEASFADEKTKHWLIQEIGQRA